MRSSFFILTTSALIFGCGQEAPPKAEARDVPHLEGDTIVFSKAFRDRAKITTVPVAAEPFRPAIRLTGTVALNPAHVAVVGARVRGTVRRTFKVEGDRVTANEALAEIESAELGEAQSSVLQAEASLYSAEVNAKREQDLLGRSLTTAREAEVATTELVNKKAALAAAQQRVRAYGGSGAFGVFVVKSPIAGHVVSGHLAPGESVEASKSSFKIADTAHLWVELSVFEHDLSALRVGDPVELRPTADPEVRIAGKVAHVGEVIDPTTRSTDVRVTVDDPPYHLRPGQAVTAEIATAGSGREALLVPHESVVYVDGKPTVFVAENELRMRTRAVRLGASDGNRYEVTEGVAKGDVVAKDGVFALKSELFR